MILQSLAKLAEREGLIENPDYQPGEVSWVIRLKPDGRFITLESLLTPPEGKKGKPRGQRGAIPRPFPGAKRSGTKPDAAFLVDNAAFVLGRDYSKEQRAGSREGELERRLSEFKRHIKAAAEATKLPSLEAVLAFLNNAEETEKAREEAGAKAESKNFPSNHLIAFHVEGDAGFVHSLSEVQSYWASVRLTASSEADGVQCLITGEIAPPIDKHPPIKRVPGGSSSGVSIVSYNSSAYESYGFKRNENAPVSRAAAEAYATALNRLLEPATLDPKQPGVRLPEQRVQISDDTVAVFWTDQPNAVPAAIRPALDEEDDALDFFDVQLAKPAEATDEEESRDDPAPQADAAPSATALRDEIERPWKGRKATAVEDDSPFRLLILSGGQGRATIRAFHTSHTKAIVANIQKWFTDIELEGWHGSRALYQMLRALALRGDRKNLPPSLAADVFVAILTGKPLPVSVLEAAVRRARSESDSVFDERTGKTYSGRKVTSQRAALLKAYFNRLARQRKKVGQPISFQEVKPAMNETERNNGYLLGRMFACVEMVQRVAHASEDPRNQGGGINATVVDRYFRSACARPQAVFPQLLKNATHNYRKAEGYHDWRSGKAEKAYRIIGHITSLLVAQENGMPDLGHEADLKDQLKWMTALMRASQGTPHGFPGYLNLEQQGLFTLGYHQQRNEFFTKRDKATSDEPAETAAK